MRGVADTMLIVLAAAVLIVLVASAARFVRVRRTARAAVVVADRERPRVTGEVRAGVEQVLIHLARALGLPSGVDDVGYGGIYLAGEDGSVLTLRSRSEIGRGFEGEVRVRRVRSASVVEYLVLRVPDDEALHRAVAALDDRVGQALTSMDPAATVRRTHRAGRLPGFTPTTR